MAENKKSFVAYADWKNTFDLLNDEQAGKLIKHIFSYVNDENPNTDEILIKLAFEPIKMQLKRDLKKYEEIKIKRSIAGKKSAELRQQVSTNPTLVDFVQQTSTNSTDNVNDNVNVNVNDNVINKDIYKFNFKKSLSDIGADEKLISEWMAVRKTKKATNTETAFNLFKNEVEKSGNNVNEVLKKCIENSWSGFKSEWFKNSEKKSLPIRMF